MKKAVTAVLLSLLCTGTSLASPATCDQYRGLAMIVMTNRQNGMTQGRALSLLYETLARRVCDYTCVLEGKAAQAIIAGAYVVPRYTTKFKMQSAVDEYEDQVYMECERTIGN